MIAAEHSNDGAWTAVDYLDEARQLIEAADAIVRREHAKKVPPRDLATLH
jgi:hypothetical protein